MIIELNEDEMVTITRLYQIYYEGMYHDLYEKHGTAFPCDKYCEEYMKSNIESIVMKLNQGAMKFQK